MRFSEAWLREYVNPAIDTDALVHQLTMAGLEVDSVTPAAGDFKGVVVAEILDAQIKVVLSPRSSSTPTSATTIST